MEIRIQKSASRKGAKTRRIKTTELTEARRRKDEELPKCRKRNVSAFGRLTLIFGFVYLALLFCDSIFRVFAPSREISLLRASVFSVVNSSNS